MARKERNIQKTKYENEKESLKAFGYLIKRKILRKQRERKRKTH